MKIIAHTAYGYMVEMSPTDLSKITGDSKHRVHQSGAQYRHGEYSHAIGTEFAVSKTYDHLVELLANEDKRKRIAESLRAAATLIEHTPSPIVELVSNETPAE